MTTLVCARSEPGLRAVLLPGVGHWPQLEDPEGFEAELLDFLAEPDQARH